MRTLTSFYRNRRKHPQANDQARQFLRTLAEQKEDTAMAREAAAGIKRVEKQNQN